MIITGYEALCNLGNNIDEIYEKAINGDTTCFDNLDGYITDDYVHAGQIKTDLPAIENEVFNLRCNRLLLKNLELLEEKISQLKNKYSNDRIGIQE